jgi:hypothetical protein
MSNLTDLERFKQYYRLIEKMIDEVEKETLAEAARILAINVVHYSSKYGELPLEETLALLHAETINDSQAKLLADGMEHLAAVIAMADKKGGGEREDAVH